MKDSPSFVEIGALLGDQTRSVMLGRLMSGEALGFDVAALAQAKRPVCRPCLDWSVRRHHAAGGLGRALLSCCLRNRWARTDTGSRIVRFSQAGEERFLRTFVADSGR